MTSPRRISPVSPRPRDLDLSPVPNLSLSRAQVVGFLETTYRNQNPNDDYHVIYVQEEDCAAAFIVYKSFNEMCRDVAHQFDLDVYASTPGINPHIDIVIGAPWETDPILQKYYETVISYAKGIYDGHPLIYTSSPTAANKLKNCLVQMVQSVQ